LLQYSLLIFNAATSVRRALTTKQHCPMLKLDHFEGVSSLAEIASAVAIIIALAALYLGNLAHRQVDSTFENFTHHVAKQIRTSQAELAVQAKQLQVEFQSLKSTAETAEAKNLDLTQKIHLLTQRIAVLEHDLKSLTEAIPPQLRRPPPKRASDSMG
tara:strand:- start:1172 stop:1645 length:474 start_codon:yes stop_codon:yes gene_type:complete